MLDYYTHDKICTYMNIFLLLSSVHLFVALGKVVYCVSGNYGPALWFVDTHPRGKKQKRQRMQDIK